jgi:hypothetical protein
MKINADALLEHLPGVFSRGDKKWPPAEADGRVYL